MWNKGGSSEKEKRITQYTSKSVSGITGRLEFDNSLAFMCVYRTVGGSCVSYKVDFAVYPFGDGFGYLVNI